MRIIDLLMSSKITNSKKLCIEFVDVKKDCDLYRFVGSIDEAIDFTKKNNLENFKVYEQFSITDSLMMITCDNYGVEKWKKEKIKIIEDKKKEMFDRYLELIDEDNAEAGAYLKAFNELEKMEKEVNR